VQSASTIFWLATKELRSFFRDWVLLGLVLYSFTLAIIAQAQSNAQELRNASIAVVDEDRSELSRGPSCRRTSSRSSRSPSGRSIT